jgi:hypothetical protein
MTLHVFTWILPSKKIWISKSRISWTTAAASDCPSCYPYAQQESNQYYMIFGILHFERFSDTKQVQNHALCQGCLDHIKAHLSLMHFFRSSGRSSRTDLQLRVQDIRKHSACSCLQTKRTSSLFLGSFALRAELGDFVLGHYLWK